MSRSSLRKKVVEDYEFDEATNENVPTYMVTRI